MRRWFSIALFPIVLVGCSLLPKPPDPTEPPEPPVDPPYTESCQALLDEGTPWCHLIDPPMTCGDCVHNPTQDPKHCEKAPECVEPPPPLPEPQCEKFINRGGQEQCVSGQCDCYCGEIFWECQEPPPAGDCPWGTPTARSLVAQGVRVEVRPKREGRRGIGATPTARFGTEYYCQEGLWPEACAAGRRYGPVTPDGHPDRIACEKQFLELDCAHFTNESSGHFSFDPWISMAGINQNHPRNVESCGQGQFETHSSWVKDGGGYIQGGQWSWATAHAEAGAESRICAEARDGAGKSCISFVEP
jgi:hypothetical protein